MRIENQLRITRWTLVWNGVLLSLHFVSFHSYTYNTGRSGGLLLKGKTVPQGTWSLRVSLPWPLSPCRRHERTNLGWTAEGLIAVEVLSREDNPMHFILKWGDNSEMTSCPGPAGCSIIMHYVFLHRSVSGHCVSSYSLSCFKVSSDSFLPFLCWHCTLQDCNCIMHLEVFFLRLC